MYFARCVIRVFSFFRILRMAKSKAQEKVAKTRTKPKTSKNLQLPINFIIITASMAVAVWFGYKGYLETRVNTPYDAKKACNLLFNNLTLKILCYTNHYW